jgi:phage I-like protein
MPGYQILLDAPATPTSRLPIAQLGDYKHARYGDFSITASDVQDWARNLSLLPGGRGLIDLDHQADRAPRKTEAAGWITGINLAGDQAVADVEWTPGGRQAIEETRYLFFSPSYGPFTDHQGGVHDNTCTGGALTNKPFIGSLPMITLAAPETVHRALEQGEIGEVMRLLYAQPATSDSPPPMPNELKKLLGLPDDADDKKLLDAVTALVDKATEPAPTPTVKTLDQMAKDEGKILLDSAQYASLELNARQGAAAAKQLHAATFETAFTNALGAGRAIPAQKDQLTKFYELDAPGTLKMLDEGPTIVNVKPRGGSAEMIDLGAPEGVHPGSHGVDAKVRAKLTQLNKPFSEYSVTLDQMFADGEL